jgi:hypothetical protein
MIQVSLKKLGKMFGISLLRSIRQKDHHQQSGWRHVTVTDPIVTLIKGFFGEVV